ncbi:MAG: DNA topoisomerase [Leptospirillum sp. Group IV 'UBA BS']|nr:MAG: DNA topoisomerase [Leptospirillum sp. Group IV 'UBA BS']
MMCLRYWFNNNFMVIFITIFNILSDKNRKNKPEKNLMKLVIAEKPSMARAIQDVVGREYEVTNAFGHILELAEPDDYLPRDIPVNPKTRRKLWRACDLPIIPSDWKQIPNGRQRSSSKKSANS